MFRLGTLLTFVGVCILFTGAREFVEGYDHDLVTTAGWTALSGGWSLLLLSRRPLGYFMVFAGSGAALYATESLRAWAPAGWHGSILLAGVVLTAVGIALPLTPGVTEDGPAFALLLALIGLITIGHDEIRWPSVWQSMIADAIVVVSAVILGLRLRSTYPERVSFAIAAVGVASFLVARSDRVPAILDVGKLTFVAATVAVIGMIGNVIHNLDRDDPLKGMFVALGWSAVCWLAADPFGRGLGLTPSSRTVFRVLAVALLVLAGAMAATAWIGRLCLAHERFRARQDTYDVIIPVGAAALAVACIVSVLLSGFAVALTVRVFLVVGAFLLLLVAAALFWVGLAVTIDGELNTNEPNASALDNLVLTTLNAVLVGPKALGPSPFVAYSGVVFLTLRMATSGWLGGVLAILGSTTFIVGLALLAYRVVEQIRSWVPVEFESRHASLRVLFAQLDEQRTLLPSGVLALGVAIVALWAASHQWLPWPVRVMLAVAAAAGLTGATAPALRLRLGFRYPTATVQTRRLFIENYGVRNMGVRLLRGTLAAFFSLVCSILFAESGLGKFIFLLIATAAAGYGFLKGWEPFRQWIEKSVSGADAFEKRFTGLLSDPRPAFRLMPPPIFVSDHRFDAAAEF